MNVATDRIDRLSPEQRDLLLRRLAERRGEDRAAGPAAPRLTPRPEERHEPFPLSDVQESLWIGRSGLYDLGDIGANAYFELHFPAFPEERIADFQRALRRCIERHDMLRAVMLSDGRQRVLAEVPPYEAEVIDLRALATDQAEERLMEARQRLRHRKAPVDRWPLFDFVLHLLGGGALRLMVRFELLVVDGLTRLALFRELFALLRDPSAELPAIDCTYRDCVLAWREFEGSPAYRRSQEFWLRRLPSLPPPPELPRTLGVEPRTPSRFTFVSERVLAPEEWTHLKERAVRAGLTPSLAVTAAYVDTLAVWSLAPRFTLGLEGAFPPPLHAHVERVLGNFHTLVLLAVESWADSFTERALALQRESAAALDYPWMSGFRVLRELGRVRGPGSRALAPILFNTLLEYNHPSYEHFRPDAPDSGLAYGYVDAGAYVPQLQLINTVIEAGGALLSRWKSVEGVFPPGMIGEMVAAFARHLRRLADLDSAWCEPWTESLRHLVPSGQRRVEARVLDDWLEPRPDHVPGEIWTVARDGSPDGSVVHPRSGERLVRTGEVGRYLRDGGIEVLGRVGEWRIEILGYPVEPREVEAALCRHPGVRRAVVRARKDNRGTMRLAAWAEPAGAPPPAPRELQSFLAAQLPYYMVPSLWALLPLPDDLSDLPAPWPLEPAGSGSRLPDDGLELWLADLWEEVLGRRPASSGDDFFALGGDSLALARVMARARESFGPDLPLWSFFERPTIERLAALLRPTPQPLV